MVLEKVASRESINNDKILADDLPASPNKRTSTVVVDDAKATPLTASNKKPGTGLAIKVAASSILPTRPQGDVAPEPQLIHADAQETKPVPQVNRKPEQIQPAGQRAEQNLAHSGPKHFAPRPSHAITYDSLSRYFHE